MSKSTIVCDFCSSDKPMTAFHAKDFKMLEGVLNSTGEWAACLECRDLVLAEKWDELENRSVETFQSSTPIPKEMVRVFIKGLHKKFREAMSGERTEIG